MSYEASNGTESTAPTASAMPTGYRVGVVPGAIEVSARLGTAAEFRDLIRVFRAGILIFADDGDTDVPEKFAHRVAAIKAASLKQSCARAVALNIKFGELTCGSSFLARS